MYDLFLCVEMEGLFFVVDLLLFFCRRGFILLRKKEQAIYELYGGGRGKWVWNH